MEISKREEKKINLLSLLLKTLVNMHCCVRLNNLNIKFN